MGACEACPHPGRRACAEPSGDPNVPAPARGAALARAHRLRAQRRHDRPVMTDGAVLEPPGPEAERFHRRERDPQRCEDVAAAASDGDVPRELARAQPQAGGLGQRKQSQRQAQLPRSVAGRSRGCDRVAHEELGGDHAALERVAGARLGAAQGASQELLEHLALGILEGQQDFPLDLGEDRPGALAGASAGGGRADAMAAAILTVSAALDVAEFL